VFPFDRPALYPIVDAGLCAARGLDPEALGEACLRGGAKIIQLRFKQGSDEAFLALADRLRTATRQHGGLLIVNDRPDIALMSGADGLHVGQEDLPVEAVRSLLGPAAVVGLSSHDEAQADAALSTTASYVAVGPVFTTETKATGYDARGLALVSYAAARGKPVIAIGGITLDRAPLVARAGASGLAVISDLLSGDPEARVRAFIAALR
jgi:thiamine-phosphate pyrophosphorylase